MGAHESQTAVAATVKASKTDDYARVAPAATLTALGVDAARGLGAADARAAGGARTRPWRHRRLRIGNVVPADVQLLSGDHLMIDQSALTGESLPVTRRPGGVAYASTIVKQGGCSPWW
jgi:high-affinity K+ transport system ATPase subunit B